MIIRDGTTNCQGQPCSMASFRKPIGIAGRISVVSRSGGKSDNQTLNFVRLDHSPAAQLLDGGTPPCGAMDKPMSSRVMHFLSGEWRSFGPALTLVLGWLNAGVNVLRTFTQERNTKHRVNATVYWKASKSEKIAETLSPQVSTLRRDRRGPNAFTHDSAERRNQTGLGRGFSCAGIACWSFRAAPKRAR